MKMTEANDMIVIMNTTDEERKILLALAKNKPIPPKLLCGAEVATICRVHRKSIQRWAKAGLIRPIKLGRRKVMYEEREIIDFARNGNQVHGTTGDADSTNNGRSENTNQLNGGATCA